jgi:hypothetical protein
MTYPLNALIKRTGIEASQVEDVLIGCVTQTGEQGWCVGRTGVLAAGWPFTVPSTTINRLCGSGQQALNFAANGIEAKEYELVVAGGLEHMTRVPMFSDCGGEESPFLKHHHPDLVQQGLAAEILSEEFKISRQDADAFALRSQKNAKRALDEGRFSKSMVPVEYKDEQGTCAVFDRDDNPRPETTNIQTGRHHYGGQCISYRRWSSRHIGRERKGDKGTLSHSTSENSFSPCNRICSSHNADGSAGSFETSTRSSWTGGWRDRSLGDKRSFCSGTHHDY